MAGGGGGGEQQQQSSGLDVLWGMLLVVGVLGLIWWYFGDHIIYFYLWLKQQQIIIINYITLKIFDQHFSLMINGLQSVMNNPESVSLMDKLFFINDSGKYLAGLFSIIMLGLSFKLMFKHPNSRFKTIFNTKTLAAQEISRWPQITPATHFDLVNEDVSTGPWAMSLSPMEFAKKNDLLILDGIKHKSQRAAKKAKTTAKIDIDKSNHVFAQQLGPAWSGPQNTPVHIQVLYVALSAKIHHESDFALEIFNEVSASFTKDYKITAPANLKKLVKKYSEKSTIKKLSKQHAYRLTFMASLLQKSRDDGVQSTADFLWLKTIDRPLWYMLNSVGRRVAFPEVAGPYAHWTAEKKYVNHLNRPTIEQATLALEEAISQIIYTDEDDEDLPVTLD